MQVRRTLLVSSVFAFGLAVACGDSATADDDDVGTDDAGSSSGGSSSGSGGSSGASSSSSSGGSSGGGSSSGQQPDASTVPVRPVDCEVLPVGALANGPGLTPMQYGAQPTFRGVVTTPGGEAVLDDQLLVRVDASTGVGTYDLAPPGGETNCYERGAQCVYVNEDLFDGSANAFFVAVAGRLRITDQITTDQSAGVLDYVELREAGVENRNVPYNQANLVPDGRCYWVENAPFDTRRATGCDPTAVNTCGNDETCVPENAAGSDGTCRGSTDSDTNGAPCSQDASGATNCAVGFACSTELDPDDRKCRQRCNLFAAGNDCPQDTACSTFGYCEPVALSDDDIGDLCTPIGAFCGTDGARGVCFPANGTPAACYAFARSRAACTAVGLELGYSDIRIGQIVDRSIGNCVPIP